jgi:DNA-3-methyladenine glycosylase II
MKRKPLPVAHPVDGTLPIALSAAEQHLRRSGKRMAALVDRIGPCQLRFNPPDFGSLARSIVYQQISIRAARSIHTKLTEACAPNGTLRPEAVLATSDETLRQCGLSAPKVRYLRSLAEATAQGLVRFEDLPAMDDDGVIATLTQVKGIGVWTAQMFLIFSLQRPDMLPCGDLGIRNAVAKLHRLREVPAPGDIERIGRPWRPYASAASWYLWRSLEPEGPF